MGQREETVDSIQRAGGPAAAVAAGQLEGGRPEAQRAARAEYEASGVAGTARHSSSGSSGGLTIQHGGVQQGAPAAELIGGSDAGAGGADPLGMLLGGGGGWGDEPESDASGRSAADDAQAQKRAQRRKTWWRRGSGGGGEQAF